MRISARVLAAALLALPAVGAGVACVGSDGDEADAAVPVPSKDRFDRERAWRLLREQVALGPRPAGSAMSRRLADRLRLELPEGRFEAVPGGLRNVVGRLPGTRPAVVIGAHYDTKDLPGFVGANDGASGVAVLVELARSLRYGRRRGAPELRFVLFDGEEAPRGRDEDFLRYGVRGSRAYVRAHRREVRSMILLDFVGDRDLSLPREAGSDPALWSRLRAAARRVGVGRVFPNRVTGEVFDDHTLFTRAGIPAIDLIDFDYPYFHTRRDTLDKVSRRSLDAVGEAVVEMGRGL